MLRAGGHAGGTLSIMDITAALYLRVADHDPDNPNWEDRDRIIWSAGHKAPSLYLGLAFAGFCPIEDVVHAAQARLALPGTSPLAEAAGRGSFDRISRAGPEYRNWDRIGGEVRRQEHKMFCIMGDGEQQEGQIWEAAMEARHHGLDNLVGIIDCNRLQIDGRWPKS